MKRTVFRKAVSLILVMVLCLSICAAGDGFSVKTYAVTQNQYNIVNRADYLYGLTWVAQKTVTAHAYNSYYTFYAGNTYHLPYGQGSTSNYIGYGVTPETFMTAAADANSVFYQYKCYAGSWYSTYYITDCSGFVSWCWGLTAKQSTRSLANYSSYVASVTTSNICNYLQLGDAINRYDYHVVLVTDLVYDSSGALIEIEITEQTIPETRRTTYTPAELASTYASYDGIYRYNGTVPAAPKVDEEDPVISEVKISELSSEGYTVTCKVTDDCGIRRVAFPTWTTYNDQDDLADYFMSTQVGTQSGDYFTFRVNASDHNNETGLYETHIYAEDWAGHTVCWEIEPIEVRDDHELPVITDVVYSDVSAAGYTISCKVTDDWGVNRVSFPTWTTYNDQDDLAAQFLTTQLGERNGDWFTYRVNTSDHNNETGEYITHIYAIDCAGNMSSIAPEAVLVRNDDVPPVITNAVVSDITEEGYTVTCTVTDDWGVNSVSFPTWTQLNDQDDLAEEFMKTQLGTKNGDTYTFYVKTADHNNETGVYITHIYAKDCAGNVVNLELNPIKVGIPALEKITLLTSSGYTRGDTFLSSVRPSTAIDTLLAEFENEALEVVDKNGTVLTGSALVGTGSIINLYSSDALLDTVTVVIIGDVDGDGRVKSTDYMRIKSAFIRTFTLNEVENSAADVDGNNKIDATDYMRVKAQFLGEYNLYR